MEHWGYALAIGWVALIVGVLRFLWFCSDRRDDE
jgi:hypothetical protein